MTQWFKFPLDENMEDGMCGACGTHGEIGNRKMLAWKSVVQNLRDMGVEGGIILKGSHKTGIRI
jgi:hypothetical protein